MFTCTCSTPGCSPRTWVMVRSQCSQEISGTASFTVAMFVLSFAALEHGCPSTSTPLSPAESPRPATASRPSCCTLLLGRVRLGPPIQGDGAKDRGVAGTLFHLVEASPLGQRRQQAVDVIGHLLEVAYEQGHRTGEPRVRPAEVGHAQESIGLEYPPDFGERALFLLAAQMVEHQATDHAIEVSGWVRQAQR